MKAKNRRRVLLLLALAAMIAAGLVSQWRFRAVALKLAGELPTVGWEQIISLFGAYLENETSRRAGLVTLAGGADGGPCSLRWATPIGNFWGNAGDEEALELVVREQLIDRVYLNSTVVIEPGDVVFDVGSHLGSFSRMALAAGAARVIAVEPEPRNGRCFEKTFAGEIAAGAVTMIAAAAWRQSGWVQFTGDGVLGRVDQGGALEVRAVTLDGLVEELGLERVDFIKMDIEGGEADALAGSLAILERFGPRMSLAIYHHPDHRQKLPELARSVRPGYRVKRTAEFAYFY